VGRAVNSAHLYKDGIVAISYVHAAALPPIANVCIKIDMSYFFPRLRYQSAAQMNEHKIPMHQGLTKRGGNEN